MKKIIYFEKIKSNNKKGYTFRQVEGYYQEYNDPKTNNVLKVAFRKGSDGWNSTDIETGLLIYYGLKSRTENAKRIETRLENIMHHLIKNAKHFERWKSDLIEYQNTIITNRF